MLRRLRRSIRRSPFRRFIKITFLLFIVGVVFDSLTKVIQYRSSSDSVLSVARQHPRVFIAGIHWNNEIILRSHWNDAVVRLVDKLGHENTFVSIYESGSWDDSKGALRSLDKRLSESNVSRSIILDDITHADEISMPPGLNGWIQTTRADKQLRRIPYLARLRNIVLDRLSELSKNHIMFDRVLFLNDVVFSTEDVLELLATRGGNYAAACSMDFAKPPQFYDTFALRDAEGHEAVMPTFPYFRAKSSRDAITSGQPTPVTSCWNGIVAFDADPFYATPPLQFRGIPDSLAQYHLEASECCLIHADNPLTKTRGVWLNPNVRVGYSATAYEKVYGGPSVSEMILGAWMNRLRRWITPTIKNSWRIDWRLRKWRKTAGQLDEAGRHCLINEMQVLAPNGWAHI